MRTVAWIALTANLIKIVMWYGGDKVGWAFPIEETWIITILLVIVLIRDENRY